MMIPLIEWRDSLYLYTCRHQSRSSNRSSGNIIHIAALIIALLLIIIGGWFRQNQKCKFKKRKKLRPTPPSKELYYNVRPSFEQELKLTGQMQPKCPILMYDDIITTSK